MIKKFSTHITMLINKLYSNNASKELNKKVLHTILKNDLTAKLKDNEEEIFFAKF